MKKTLLAALLFTALFAGNAFAGLIITVEEVGADLKFSYSGSLVMATGGTDDDPGGFSYGSSFFRAYPILSSGRGFSSNFNGTFTLTSGTTDSFFSGSGSSASFAAGSQNLYIGQTDVVNRGRIRIGTTANGGAAGTYSATGSFTVAGRNFSSIGYTVGESRTWSWTQTGQSPVLGNTLTISAVPEPGSLVLVGGLLAGLTSFSRRRRKA